MEKLILDENEVLSQYNIKDIVLLKKDYPYENFIMKEIVNQGHPFLIMDTDQDVCLVYALGSDITRYDKYPDFYTKIRTHNKSNKYGLGVVELNAYGWINENAIQERLYRISDNDYEKVLKSIKKKKPIRTTITEKI